MKKKFEYYIVNHADSNINIDLGKWLNELGLEGWELVATNGTMHEIKKYIFKREIR